LASGHHNDPIVRQKPQFSPALAAKNRSQRSAIDESQDEELQWLKGVDALDSAGYLENSQFSNTGKMTAIFAEDENESELFN